MVRNYDFVNFPEKPDVYFLTDINKRVGDHSGVIKLKIKAADDIYVGSGFLQFDGKRNKILGETLQEQGKAIIPGSTIRGAVRSVAKAISDSCITADRSIKLTGAQQKKCNAKNDDLHICMTCDMFGAMGLGSKIRFGDFTAERAEIVSKNVPSQFSPHPESQLYKNEKGFHKGYKFYYTFCDEKDVPKREMILAVKKGAEFFGEIGFEGLFEEEFILLLQSLGPDGYFSHKLGGYKSVGFGTVNFICTELILNGKEISAEDVKKYALRYKEKISPDRIKRFNKLCDIMKYKKG